MSSNVTFSLSFLGAAGTVTGSKHLLELGGRRILVDCGLFQGLKELRLRNWQPLPVDPASIDAVVLTHAHLDHSGYLPRLVAGGYRGRIFCTPATKDLCGLVLPDSAHIQEEDAREANRHGFTKHQPALPLYTSVDAARALDRLQPVGYERPVPLWGAAPGTSADGVAPTVEFINAGHLLGSAYARIRYRDLNILFGGDLGRYGRPVLPDPSPVAEADILLLESTYGNRLHEPDDNGERLATIVRETAARGGKLIVPAFAIGRVEEVLYWLKRLEDEKRIPSMPVYVDSPMAVGALQFYAARLNELDADMSVAGSRSDRGQPPIGSTAGRDQTQSGDGEHTPNAPRPDGVRKVTAFATARLTMVASPQQSADLIASRQPSIVVSSSGMATGGRVLRHLAATITNPKNTVMFVGYQAEGTRGRLLIDGAREIKLLGRTYPVAARIEAIDSMSAHADYSEILRWLSGFTRPPRMTYLVHGDPAASEALAERITRELKWPVHIAAYLEHVAID
ncbi:MAG TPA: MBL fold metallo-hydrolase [Vicinamibacterales bacterium]|nr:MBL fold metallo-hydrolase [Vicinamibacterales bacterium]